MNGSRWSFLTAALLASGAAFAANTRVVVHDHEPDALIQVGGGVSDFTTGLDKVTESGPAADVRLVFAPKNPIGMEAAFFAGTNDFTGSDNTSLLTNGGEALIRANLGGEGGDVQPYIGAGLGLAAQTVVAQNNFSDAVKSEKFGNSTDLVVPAGA